MYAPVKSTLDSSILSRPKTPKSERYFDWIVHNLWFLFIPGLLQAPAIGRGIMELMLDDKYETIDLSKFGFDRFLRQQELPKEDRTFA